MSFLVIIDFVGVWLLTVARIVGYLLYDSFAGDGSSLVDVTLRKSGEEW